MDTDRDSIDCVSRYVWNLALAAALQTTLHVVEVTFRSALFEAGVRATAGRSLRYGRIACWLEARPSLLQPREEAAVVEARKGIVSNRRRCTPGHLVARLGFGFWLRLCHPRTSKATAAGRNSGQLLLELFQDVQSRRETAPTSGARSESSVTSETTSHITSPYGTGIRAS